MLHMAVLPLSWLTAHKTLLALERWRDNCGYCCDAARCNVPMSQATTCCSIHEANGGAVRCYGVMCSLHRFCYVSVKQLTNRVPTSATVARHTHTHTHTRVQRLPRAAHLAVKLASWGSRQQGGAYRAHKLKGRRRCRPALPALLPNAAAIGHLRLACFYCR